MQCFVIVAAGTLLPETSLAEIIALASFRKRTRKELDAIEVRRQGYEGSGYVARAGPKLQGPLRVWVSLTVGDHSRLEAAGKLRNIMEVVCDVFRRNLHVAHGVAS